MCFDDDGLPLAVEAHSHLDHPIFRISPRDEQPLDQGRVLGQRRQGVQKPAVSEVAAHDDKVLEIDAVDENIDITLHELARSSPLHGVVEWVDVTCDLWVVNR